MSTSLSTSSREQSMLASSSTRVSTSVSTRAMARSRLGQASLNAPLLGSGMSYTERPGRVMTGGKRKSIEQNEEGRKRKVSRYSGGDQREGTRASFENQRCLTPPKITTLSMVAKSAATGAAVEPVTPVRSIQPTSAPTPARDLLKAGYKASVTEDATFTDSPPHNFVLKPPTPPRMHPRPAVATAMTNPLPPHTPGKRSLSPDQPEMRSAKRPVQAVGNATEEPLMAPCTLEPKLPTTPSGPTPVHEIMMLTSSKHLLVPSVRRTIASPHKALASISRLNTPGRPVGNAGASRTVGVESPSMRPTVPTSFSFSTPRDAATKPDIIPSSAAHEVSAPSASAPNQSAPYKLDESALVSEKEVRPLPKRSSMAPPSKIPVRTSKSSLPSLSTSVTIPAAAGSSKPKPSLGIAERRPTRSARTTSGNGPTKLLAVFDENAAVGQASDAPVRRKPSYPSSLGSGPLAQPRARLVSGPIQPPRSFTAPMSASTSMLMEIDTTEPVRPTPRSVSDPVSRPRSSLSASTSRREGFTADTSRSLAGLSDALAKLKVKRDSTASTAARHAVSAPARPKPAVLAEVIDCPNTTNTVNTSLTASTRLTSVHRPRSSIIGADVSMTEEGDRSIAALMCSTGSSSALRGVVAFVDVRTEDGACSGDVWSEMLRGLGAKVNVRLTSAVTHIIYKSGLPTTLAWYRRQSQEERPYIVGVGWLLKSKKGGERLDEAEFTVDIGVEDIFQKRRKSMEPKALLMAHQGQSKLDLSSFPTASAVRKDLLYMPKISSPLKKAYTRDMFD